MLTKYHYFMINAITIKTVCLFTVITTATNSFTCPTSSWTEYKSVEEGPWSFVIPNYNPQETVNFVINQTFMYDCLRKDMVTLRITRKLSIHSAKPSVLANTEYRYIGNLGTCKQECNEIEITVEIRYRFLTGNNSWSGWSSLDDFNYLNKNCDKLYWTGWIETSNCNSSLQTRFKRLCVDCDGESVDSKFCNGSTTTQMDCWPVWSEWGKFEPCSMSGCNTTGERVRRRKCLYGNGSEAPIFQLCSNQTSFLIEQCNDTDNSVARNKTCQPAWSSWSESEPCIATGCNTTGERIKRRKCLHGNGSEAFNTYLCSNESAEMRVHCVRTYYTVPFACRISEETDLRLGVRFVFPLFLFLCAALGAMKFRQQKAKEDQKIRAAIQSSVSFEVAVERSRTRPETNSVEREQPSVLNAYELRDSTILNTCKIQPTTDNTK